MTTKSDTQASAPIAPKKDVKTATSKASKKDGLAPVTMIHPDGKHRVNITAMSVPQFESKGYKRA